MGAILEVQNLYKVYRRGRKPALNGLSFEVESGSIYAFVGPNGAGKTTTIRIISTLLKADGGVARVGGYRVDQQPLDVRRLMGYIPDEFGLYDEMPVQEYMEFFASCYKVPVAKRPAMVNDLLELVGLTERRNDEVRGLSRGMRQRLGLARALVHEPALIIADEPASGLDPRARVELREILRALQEMGKTIFLSSHVLRELDDIATHVGIVEGGRLVVSGPVEEIRRQLRPHRRLRITFLGASDDAHAWLTTRSDVVKVEPAADGNGDGRAALWVAFDGDEKALVGLLGAMVTAGYPVISFTEEKETLEGLFMDLTQGGIS